MQWNVEQAKTHAQRPGEFFPPFNRIFSFVLLKSRANSARARLADSIEIHGGYIVDDGLKISKPFFPNSSFSSSKYPSPFPPRDDFQPRIPRPSISSTPLGPSLTNFIKFHPRPSTRFVEDTRRWKLARFDRGARSKSKSKPRHRYIYGSYHKSTLFSAGKMGLRDADAAAGQIQSTYPRGTYERNFIKRGGEGGEREELSSSQRPAR